MAAATVLEAEDVSTSSNLLSLTHSKDLYEQMDVVFEQELQRNPFDVKIWCMYIKAKQNSPSSVRFLIYERALHNLPGSFKIWWIYLQDRLRGLKEDSDIYGEGYKGTNIVFERCIVHQYKRPMIWLLYCNFLIRQNMITRTRRCYDRALRSLPITQHSLIWNDYLEFVKTKAPIKTAICVYTRASLLLPDVKENLVELLIQANQMDTAASILVQILQDDQFISKQGKTHHQLWMHLCDLVSQHPHQIHTVKIEPILRDGISKFSDEVGHLWCSFADYFIRLGLLEKARDIYEEAITTVTNIHDFSIVFDAYSNFQESVLSSLMDDETNSDEIEIDLYIARLENLMNRRMELISSVKLRQNPHNVLDWLDRVELFKDDPSKVVKTFSEAVQTVQSELTVGRLSTLWTKFAFFYEENDDIKNAENVFLKAISVDFKNIDELASIWCEWIEMLLRHKMYTKALDIARKSISKPISVEVTSSQNRLFRSVKLWSLVIDLEEVFGTHNTLSICFHKMLSLKVVTPQIIINYAHYLEENRYFEESFKVYEIGVSEFKWPHLNDIWLMYLTKFVSHYGSTKLERARELFDQAINSKIPNNFAKRFYILYAQLEERYGLARHALSIYHKAIQNVQTQDKLQLYILYIAKTSDLFGIAKTRKIYEEAIRELPDDQVREICLQYAQVERSLGEIDRARAIYKHASQFFNPTRFTKFWKIWKDFEINHGNEDSFRDMLRLKRSVSAQYSQIHFNASELTSDSNIQSTDVNTQQATDAMAMAEQQSLNNIQANKDDSLQTDSENIDLLSKPIDSVTSELFYEENKRTAQQIADIDEAEREYQLMLQSQKVKNNPSSQFISSTEHFIPSKTFEGKKIGYIFKNDLSGQGYYLEEHLKTNLQLKKENEELEIDVDDLLDVQEKIIPSSLYNSLSKN